MKSGIINLNFKEALIERIPQRTQLVNLLTDIMGVERETVYRRLRGDVPFSFEEVGLICQALKISLDQLLGIEMKNQRPLVMQVVDFEKPTEEDYAIWKSQNDLLAQFVNHKSFVTYEAWTTIPFPFCYKYYNLTKFYIMKWAFQVNNHIPLKRFDEIHLDEKFYELSLEYLNLYMQGATSDFIFSNIVFRDLLKDVSFFHTIGCISDEDLKTLLDEMDSCLREWEQITVQGVYSQTGRKINAYVTDINIDTNYTLIESKNTHICLLRTFVLNPVITSDKNTYSYIKNCFQSLKRLSTQISVSGESSRIKYFENEWEIIRTMKSKWS